MHIPNSKYLTNFLIKITLLYLLNLNLISSQEVSGSEASAINTNLPNECPTDKFVASGNEDGCFSYSNSNYKCCILKNLLPIIVTDIPTDICMGFKSTSMQDIYYLKGYNYKVFCEDDFKKKNMLDNYSIAVDLSHLTKCGSEKPVVNSDCLSYSDDRGSCCLYNYSSDFRCTKLSKRYRGKVKYGGMTLDCKGNFINISSNILLSYLFLLYLFIFIE